MPDGFHQPQSSLVLMTGESSLGSHNFLNRVQRISNVEAGARAVGESVRSIELPLITESMKQEDIGGESLADMLCSTNLEVLHNTKLQMFHQPYSQTA